MDGAISIAVPPIAFLIFTVLAYIIFGMGSQMAAPFEEVSGKTEPYLCGEDIDLGPIVPSYWQFFAIAILFTILHITVFIIALMPAPAVFFVLAYIALVAASVGVLIGEVRLTVPPREKALARLQTRAKIVEDSSSDASAGK